MEYKIRIREKEEEPKEFVKLWLERDEDDSSIELKVKLSSWDRLSDNYILKIHADGHITLPRYVSPNLGFELDEGDRIVVDKEV